MDDINLWPVAAAAAIGAIAWIYEKAWQRLERRALRYEAILGDLSAFTTSQLDPDKIDQILAEQRKLWISAPVGVSEAFVEFLETVEGVPKADYIKEKALSRLIKEMRKDASLRSVLVPPIGSPDIPERYLKLKSASRRSGIGT